MIYNSETYNREVELIANISNLPFNKLANKSIMITGACGLIGSFIVDVIMMRNSKYNDNITVIAYDFKEEYIKERFSKYLDNDNFRYIYQDVNLPLDYDFHVDYIMHLASNSHPVLFKEDPVGTIKANIIGLNNLLEFAKNNKTERVLYTSTGEVYGQIEDKDEFIETDSGYVNPTLSRSCYPASKRCAETLCVSYTEQYNVDTVIARPCHTYGPTMTKNDSRVYAEFLRDILNDQDIVLKSAGNQIRSYCYVADCASAMLFILLNGKSMEAYNIANKDSVVSLKEMAEVIAKLGNKKVLFDISDEDIKKANPMKCGVLCGDKLETIGWKPLFDIEKGYSETIKILKEI